MNHYTLQSSYPSEALGIYRYLRPLLFTLPPEKAHQLSLQSLRWVSKLAWGRQWLSRQFATVQFHKERQSKLGLSFKNTLGLAAGYDKGAQALAGLAALGFGHIEVGTITLRPQAGNMGTRVKRLPQSSALVNRMGFPSEGVEIVAQRLEHYRNQENRLCRHLNQVPMIGINIGKNKETSNAQAASDYTTLIHRLADLADYITINISSPNTPNLRELQDLSPLKILLEAILTARQQVRSYSQQYLPIILKFAPEFEQASLTDSLNLCATMGVDGVILANTRRVESPLAGGLSGAPLFSQTLELIKQAKETTPNLCLIASGGVSSVEQAQTLLEAGADLIQIWTGLIYRGPQLITELSAL